MPPERRGIGVAAGDIGDGAPLHHGLRDAALLRAVPDGRRAAATLVIGVEPAGNAGEAAKIGGSAAAAAQVPDVDAVGLLFLRGVVPELPDFEHARDVLLGEGRRAAGGKALASVTRAGG